MNHPQWLLLEWVGHWAVASVNGECPGLFGNVVAARMWVIRIYCGGDMAEFEVVRSRFWLQPIELPAPLQPVYDKDSQFTGHYEPKPVTP